MSEIKTVTCPLCGKLPQLLMGETALHENDDCKVIMWDITMSLDELLMNTQSIELPTEE